MDSTTDSTTVSPNAPVVTEGLSAFELNLKERGTIYYEIGANNASALPESELAALRTYDLIYRSLCAVMYNFTGSGHPGGSVSSGRIVETLLFSTLRYNFSDPNDKSADFICYTAGHKAMGMYAMWACRNEVMRISHSDSLPDVLQQLRLEDLLGFRKNPVTKTPLFLKHAAKPLDGHPTPQTPFVWLSTGPSGIGVTSCVGMALALKDLRGASAPFVHMIEGEGGMTPGRVSEAVASAASSGLNNLIMHVDWNQAAIDSDNVTRDGDKPGDYVQWDPREFLLTHGFNVITVADGFDYPQIHEAQKKAVSLKTSAPTAIVYRTIKGWRYGIEGKKSHGAGHKFESEEYYQALEPFEKEFGLAFPRFAESKSDGEKSAISIERAYYESLMTVRGVFESQPDVVRTLGAKISARRESMQKISAAADNDGPNLAALYDADSITPLNRPANCSYKPGSKQTLRGALAHVFNDINHKTNGAILAGAADVYGSTNTLDIGAGFAGGLWHAGRNPDSRIFSAGGITEDAIGGICSGIVTIGRHLAVGASYGAFIAPLNVIAARTHAVAQQTIKQRNLDELTKTFVILCGHTGVKTGEDGPTHAEPNTLAFFQDNCPQGAVVTLTPWDAHDLWPLVVAGLKARPAVLAVYVTRPSETVFDRQSLGLAPAEDSVNGVYKLLAANGKPDATLIYQGSDVTNVFVSDVLPRLKEKGLNLDVYYIASCELFNLLAESRRAEIFPARTSRSAMMISGFSLPTTYRWVTSESGRECTLYPHKGGAYLGSGPGEMCMKEAGLDGEAQLAAIIRFVSSS